MYLEKTSKERASVIFTEEGERKSRGITEVRGCERGKVAVRRDRLYSTAGLVVLTPLGRPRNQPHFLAFIMSGEL